MELLESYQMVEIAEEIINKKLLRVLSSNLKKYRLSLYEEYKQLGKKVDNPYSSENIASLLNISRRHYKRLENPNSITKNISIEKLLILSEVYKIPLEDFFKIDSNIKWIQRKKFERSFTTNEFLK